MNYMSYIVYETKYMWIVEISLSLTSSFSNFIAVIYTKAYYVLGMFHPQKEKFRKTSLHRKKKVQNSGIL